MKKVLILFSLFCVYALVPCELLYALGDGSPATSSDLPTTPGFLNFQTETGESLIITGGYENIMKKPLQNDNSIFSGRIEGESYLIGLGYRINDWVEPYVRFGASQMDISWNQYHQELLMKGTLGWAVGGGVKLLAFKTQLTSLARLKLNLDAQMRYTTGDVDEVQIGGVSRSVSAEEFSIGEGRISAIVGFEISLKKLTDKIKTFGKDEEELAEERLSQTEDLTFYLTPYAGVVFAGSIVDAKFQDNGSVYEMTDIDDKEHFHILAGIDLVAPKYVLLNIETQFFDGESVSGGLTLKF